MSAWEPVPAVDDPDILAMDDVELEEYLDDVFAGLLEHANDWRFHDQAGYFAHEAGSDQCRSLGHVEEDFENPDTHPMGWGDEPLCEATRYGSCCSECEGECSREVVLSVWSKPGVLA